MALAAFSPAGTLKTGKRHWQREFSKQFDATSPLYGAAMSPAVDQDHCIVHVGGHDKGALLALDLETGETVWSCGEDGPAYASPVVTTLGRRAASHHADAKGLRRRRRRDG